MQYKVAHDDHGLTSEQSDYIDLEPFPMLFMAQKRAISPYQKMRYFMLLVPMVEVGKIVLSSDHYDKLAVVKLLASPKKMEVCSSSQFMVVRWLRNTPKTRAIEMSSRQKHFGLCTRYRMSYLNNSLIRICS
jgi:hypothetical protein